MPRYKVLSGIHYETSANAADLLPHDPGRHQRKKRGDIFESPRPLDEIFPNKFAKVTDMELSPVSEDRKREVARLIKSGAAEEGDRQALEQLTQGGFDTIMQGVLSRRSLPPVEEEEEKKEEVKSILGEDVTEDFPLAVANNLKVFRSPANKYNVTGKDPGVVLNPSPLKKGQVEGNFIPDYLKEMEGQ